MEKDETLHTLGPIGPEFQEIPVALQRRLYAGLRHYAETYTGIDDPERSFDLQLLMFTFLLHFLWTAFHPSEKFIAALADLRFAIESLGQGRETPFIRPQRRRGRPPMPVAAENDLALACVLIELYMRKGLTEAESAKRVIKTLRNSGVPLPKGTTPSVRKDYERLLDMRQRIRSSRVTDSLRWTYDRIQAGLSKQLSDPGINIAVLISTYEELLSFRGSARLRRVR